MIGTSRIMASSSSSQQIIKIDPDGDLILRIGSRLGVGGYQESDHEATETDSEVSEAFNHESALKASSSAGGHKRKHSANSIASGEAATERVATYNTEEDVDPEKTAVLIRVASKILTLCSPVFKAMLNGSFREAQLALSRETPPILDLPEDSPATMELLLRILHHDPTVRRERDDVDICALALACDKYSCTAAIRLWFQAFVSDKKDNCDNHEFVQLIGASYLLDDAFSFLMTTQMVTECWPPGTVEELYASLKAFGAALDDSVVKELCDGLKSSFHLSFRILKTTCLGLITDLFRADDRELSNRGGSYIVPTDGEGEDVVVRQTCAGQAQQMASFVSALISYGL
ncbi:hypothetical protein RBB50_006257 [Rhinocladiella similis]